MLLRFEGKEKKTGGMSGEVFEQKNELAMANLMIHLCLTWLRKRLFKGIWDELRDIYEGKSMSNRIHLRRNLYNLGMKESFPCFKST